MACAGGWDDVLASVLSHEISVNSPAAIQIKLKCFKQKLLFANPCNGFAFDR
jgi:hypothetical protein